MKSSLPPELVHSLKATLESERDKIDKQLVELREEDPFASDDRSRADEPGTTSLEEEGHTRIKASINASETMLTEINAALAKIEDGTYGLCENCGEQIDPKRLEAFPMATLCMKCQSEKAN